MKYLALYEKNRQFLNERPRLKKGILLFNKWGTLFFLLAYVGLWAYGIFLGEFTPKDFTKIFTFPAAALLITSLSRLAIMRPRPYEEKGEGITPLAQKDSVGNSFPSRHLTCASVIATTFLPYLPLAGGLLFLLTLALAYSRFALGWHYPSDLAGGIVLGVLCAIFVIIV